MQSARELPAVPERRASVSSTGSNKSGGSGGPLNTPDRRTSVSSLGATKGGADGGGLSGAPPLAPPRRASVPDASANDSINVRRSSVDSVSKEMEVPTPVKSSSGSSGSVEMAPGSGTSSPAAKAPAPMATAPSTTTTTGRPLSLGGGAASGASPSRAGSSTPRLHTLPLEELRAAKAGGDIDVTKKENYLDDAEFVTLFHLTRDQFMKQPKWKIDAQVRGRSRVI